MNLTISVVIPVYNEENFLGDCLAAVYPQLDHIDAVFIVDNGSTDGTLTIADAAAQQHSKITVLREHKQGVVHARNLGFDSCSSDIIARVDADCRINETWIESIVTFFESPEHADVHAVTGPNVPFDSPYEPLKMATLNVLKKSGVIADGKPFETVYGGNMAMRREAWKRVRQAVSDRCDIHEDVDLGICLWTKELKIAMLTGMQVSMSPRRAYTSPLDFTDYVKAGLRTYQLHGYDSPILRWYTAPVNWLGHAALWAAYRPYDQSRGRFSVRTLFRKPTERVSPVAKS